MWLSDCSQSPGEDTSSRKFVVNLNAMKGLEPTVRSCEVIGHNFRNRTSFGANTSIESVFVKAIADGLKECLDGIGHETKIISYHDLSIETPGLTLSGAHLMVNCDDDGELHIILRFRFFLGSLQLAFNHDIGFEDSLSDENSRLAALVIADLALPILNICEAAKVGLFENDPRFTSFANALSMRSHEISFQIELLKRFVNTPPGEISANQNFGYEIEHQLRANSS